MSQVTLIDFWSPECRPCVRLMPIIDEIKKERTDVNVVKVNVLEDMDKAVSHGVRSLPTLLFLKDGVEKQRLSGTQDKDTINQELNKLFK